MMLSQVESLLCNRDFEEELGVPSAVQLLVVFLKEANCLLEVSKLATAADCDKRVFQWIDSRGKGLDELSVQVEKISILILIKALVLHVL